MQRLYIEPKESEEKYLDYEKRGIALKMPVFKAFLDIDVILPNGKIISSTRQRSHSWVRNAYNLLGSQMMGCIPSGAYGAGSLEMKKTDGNTFDNGQSPKNNCNYAGAGVTTYGIVVGTGNNAESFENYNLQTLIAHGNGAGQLAYQAEAASPLSYDAPSKTLTAVKSRIFNNNSGGDITVQEVGIIFDISMGGNGFQSLATRDLSTKLVPNTAQLVVAYTLSEVFPA